MTATTRTSRFVGLLWVGPSAIRSPRPRVATVLAILAGAALIVVSGVIHLYLYNEQGGYKLIHIIGVLFLVQGIAGIVVGLAVAATRRLAAVLAGAGLLLGTAAGLILSIEVKLFGFKESWHAKFVVSSLVWELIGAALLLAAAWVLAFGRAADR